VTLGGFSVQPNSRYPLLLLLVLACARGPEQIHSADELRRIEHERIQALVDADMKVARKLHAEDFQLITPDGTEFTRQSYLSQVESGKLDYRVWQPGDMAVRLYDNAAVLRYDDIDLDAALDGKPARSGHLRHMVLYECRNGIWQAVWSQASGGQAGGSK